MDSEKIYNLCMNDRKITKFDTYFIGLIGKIDQSKQEEIMSIITSTNNLINHSCVVQSEKVQIYSKYLNKINFPITKYATDTSEFLAKIYQNFLIYHHVDQLDSFSLGIALGLENCIFDAIKEINRSNTSIGKKDKENHSLKIIKKFQDNLAPSSEVNSKKYAENSEANQTLHLNDSSTYSRPPSRRGIDKSVSNFRRVSKSLSELNDPAPKKEYEPKILKNLYKTDLHPKYIIPNGLATASQLEIPTDESGIKTLKIKENGYDENYSTYLNSVHVRKNPHKGRLLSITQYFAAKRSNQNIQACTPHIVIKKEKSHPVDDSCKICIETVSDIKVDLKECGHKFHKSCLVEYIKVKVDDKIAVIICPYESCNRRLSEAVLLEYLDVQYKQKHERNQIVKFREDNSKEIYTCPTKNCDYFVLADRERKVFECMKCQKIYCMLCSREYHGNVSCQRAKSLYLDEKEVKQFAEFANHHAIKKCPACNYWIQKSSGCDKIVCRCGARFCFICGQKEYECNHPGTYHA